MTCNGCACQEAHAEDVARLTKQLDEARAELAVARSLHDVAISQRDGANFLLSEVERERDEAREKLAKERYNVSLLRYSVIDLLMSADASWEERRLGHDWAEACEAARAAIAAIRKETG